MSYLSPRNNETYAEAFVREVYNDLKDIKRSFIKIGFRLNEANQNGYFKELGYNSIIELAEDKFGFKKSTTYDLIQIWQFAHDKNSLMDIDERFDKYSQRQLVEMSRSKHSEQNWRLSSIIPETASKEDIRKVIAEWNRWTCVSDMANSHFISCLKEPPLLTENSIAMENSEEEPILEESSSQVWGIATKNSALMENPEEQFTSEEIINHYLKTRRDNKFIILQFYRAGEKPDKDSFIKFLKSIYGNGGHSGDEYYRWVDYTPSKGIVIARNFGGNIVLSWSLVAGRISKLIEADEYLYPEEKEDYFSWLAQREVELEIKANAEQFSGQLKDYKEPNTTFEQEILNKADVDGGKVEIVGIRTEPRPTNRQWLQGLSDKEFVRMIYQYLWLLSDGMSPRPYIQKELEAKLIEWLSKPYKTIMEFLDAVAPQKAV